MSQPVPSVDAGDIFRLVGREFGESAEEAQAILSALSGTHPGAVARVSAAAIKLANGDLDELRRAVGVATADWRDVLAWAEYPRYMELSPDADATERRAAIDADFTSYETWLAP